MSAMVPHPTRARTKDPALRSYPFPYTAWLVLSNDPDNTLYADWQELDRVIWNEIGLPFADSLFFRSYNKNLPDQVDLFGHPEILNKHPHDTIHTWGDYLFGGSRGFERDDAVRLVDQAKTLHFKPRVWVDHSTFAGNLLHHHPYGSMPEINDASGHKYPNPLYSLDLIQEIGVRYIWDGTIIPTLGQDRPLPWLTYHLERTGSRKQAVVNLAKHKVGEVMGVGAGFRAQFKDNAAYRPHRFPDGRMFYTFQRHGQWQKADIDGLGDILAPSRIDRLIATGGVCIAYTHLGKRPAGRMGDRQHIPNRTRQGLQHLRERHIERKVMLSPLSHLLDYLVLRDNITVDLKNKGILFHADGIAFSSVDQKTLAGHTFSIRSQGITPEQWVVKGTEGRLTPRIEQNDSRCATLHFDL